MPREAWVVNEDKFKPRTTKDVSAFAMVWFHLLAHYLPFEEVISSDEQRLEFFKLLLNLRIESE